MRIELSRGLGYGLIALGVAAFLWNAAIDVEYWATQAKTARGAVEWGGASVIFQLVVLLFAGVTGHLLFRQQSFLYGGLAACVLAFFLAYNMMSVMSFGARERILPSKAQEMALKARIDAQLEAQLAQTQRQEEAIATLKESALAASAAVGKAKGKESRAAAIDAKRAADSAYLEASFATVTTEALPVEAAASDPQAEFLALFLPYPKEMIQLVMTAAWGAGLNLAKVICWFFGFGLLPRRRGDEILPVKTFQPTPGSPSRFSVVPGGVPSVHPSVRMSAQHAPPAEISSLDQVREWRAQATRPAEGARLKGHALHQHFLKWSEQHGYPLVNANLFGRHCTALGFVRDIDPKKGNHFYLGIGLCPLDDKEDAPLIMAA